MRSGNTEKLLAVASIILELPTPSERGARRGVKSIGPGALLD
jgi:hypothetical protein